MNIPIYLCKRAMGRVKDWDSHEQRKGERFVSIGVPTGYEHTRRSSSLDCPALLCLSRLVHCFTFWLEAISTELLSAAVKSWLLALAVLLSYINTGLCYVLPRNQDHIVLGHCRVRCMPVCLGQVRHARGVRSTCLKLLSRLSPQSHSDSYLLASTTLLMLTR